MNKCRSRGALLVTAVVSFSVVAYLAPLSRSPLQTERNTREDDTSITFNVNGVMRDFLEMAVDLDIHAPTLTEIGQPPIINGEVQSTWSVLPTEVTTSDQQEEADQFLDGLDQELNPGAFQSESVANVPTEIHERPSIHPWIDNDGNSTRLPITEELANPFSISESLTLPVPSATLPPKELLQQRWVSKLQQILLKMPQELGPVSIISADYKFREVLINWLIAAMTQAHPPLIMTHVIVFSLDQPLCELLKIRSINCIFVAPKDFLTQKAIGHLTKHVAFSEVMVLRLTAMRLMNHWGYDTANYDTDAIVLRSPESLYLRHLDSHLIGSYGHFPGELSRVWGTTVCCGHFMIKSSPQTETFWKTLSSVLPESTNDQAKLNYAISALHPDWGNTTSKSIMRNEWTATTPSGFNVTVLPAKYICRQACSKKHRSEYYVWHKGGKSSDGKISTAQRVNLWFLRKDWEARTSNSSVTGEEWLKEITVSV